jgi:hypothetical protein
MNVSIEKGAVSSFNFSGGEVVESMMMICRRLFYPHHCAGLSKRRPLEMGNEGKASFVCLDFMKGSDWH